MPREWIRRLRGCGRANTLFEFALVLPLLLVLIFSIFEFGRLFFTRLTMQHAVREAVRMAIVDNRIVDPESGDPMSRANSIRQTILDQAMGLNVDVDRIDIDPPDGGGPSQVVTVRAGFRFEYIVPVVADLFDDAHYDFTVQSSMKNEPFITD